MTQLKATILCADNHCNGLISRRLLQGVLDGRAKPFFSRWLDHWKSRNQVVTQ